MRTRLAAHRQQRLPNSSTALAPGWPRGARISAILGLLILGLVMALGLSACSFGQPSPRRAIVGQWANAQGGVIHFYSDRSGFIPGDERTTPPIAPVSFTYRFQDSTHLAIALDGQNPFIVEVKLEGDTMTWYAPTGDTQFVYTRAD